MGGGRLNLTIMSQAQAPAAQKRKQQGKGWEVGRAWPV